MRIGNVDAGGVDISVNLEDDVIYVFDNRGMRWEVQLSPDAAEELAKILHRAAREAREEAEDG